MKSIASQQQISSAVKETRHKPPPKKPWVHALRCFTSLVLMFTAYWLLNYCAFPLFDAVSLWTREVSAVCGGLALVVIALVAYWRPKILRRSFFPGVLALLTVGVISMLGGLYLSSVPALFVGASLLTIGISLIAVVSGLICITLDLRVGGLCIALAYAFSYALRYTFTHLSVEANLLLFTAIPFLNLFLCSSSARPIVRKILRAEPPAQTSVTAPESLLPFAHQVFITLVIFRIIYGYSLTFGEVERTPALAMFALIPLLVYVVGLLLKKTTLNPDALFRISILFSVAGFLIPLTEGSFNNTIASNLLSSGTGFFEILMYFVLVSLATKNNMNALVVLTWGNAMASLGTVVGANLGRLVNQYYALDHGILSTISAFIVFGLVVYILATQRNFSFSDTIRKVAAASPVPRGERSADFDRRCIVLAEQAKLTARESEIFALLAQGRNARFIQEKLVVSYNTVKTHVSHIYAKLDVHTHQELIDLVEGNELSEKDSRADKPSSPSS